MGIVHLVRSLCWPGGVGVGPESSAGRVCVAVAFWGNTSSPNFAKWSIFPKAAPLFAAKTVLSPPDTQHFLAGSMGNCSRNTWNFPRLPLSFCCLVFSLGFF